MGQQIAQEELHGMGVETSNGDGVVELVVLLVDFLIKNIHVQHSVAEVKEEVLQEHQEIKLHHKLPAVYLTKRDTSRARSSPPGTC